MVISIDFTLNGRPCRIDAPAHWTAPDLLRAAGQLGGEGVGGPCPGLLGGEPVRSCLVLAARLRGRAVLTVEGLDRDGEPDRLQAAFARAGAVQCGFCTPGMLLSARALLASNPSPSEQDVREALAGNLCRCTGYTKIVHAVLAAAGGP